MRLNNDWSLQWTAERTGRTRIEGIRNSLGFFKTCLDPTYFHNFLLIMAGRGCTITIQLLQPNSVVENLELQVALHTPLSVLKEQLEVATGIRVDAQILILCDLNDPERNSDILLERLDATLMQCGIENGSVLTLHGLDNIDSSKPEHIESASKSLDSDCSNVYSIVSRIDAGKADHSYNGLIFDIEVLDAFEVELTDISVAGMLGHIRVYIRDKPWRIGRTPRSSMHWWAHEDTVSTEGWTCVVDKTHGASWDVPAKVNSILHVCRCRCAHNDDFSALYTDNF